MFFSQTTPDNLKAYLYSTTKKPLAASRSQTISTYHPAGYTGEELKVRSKSSFAAHLFVLALWHRFGACGAALLLNVANVIMLPFANVASCQLRRPYWKFNIPF